MGHPRPPPTVEGGTENPLSQMRTTFKPAYLGGLRAFVVTGRQPEPGLGRIMHSGQGISRREFAFVEKQLVVRHWARPEADAPAGTYWPAMIVEPEAIRIASRWAC